MEIAGPGGKLTRFLVRCSDSFMALVLKFFYLILEKARMNKSLRSMKSGAQAGFTLIELIVVIVILGILAATAIPKFIDMSTDARVAKMHAAAGAVKAGAALYHAQWLVNADATKTVTMEGQPITGANGYPTADAAGIGLAAGIATPDYVISATGFSVSPDASRSGCSVTYTAATATAGPGIKDLADPSTCK
ncbi:MULTISPECIES: type II secretion system protein [unclassified Janthinobacterium]|uniref:pilin n=1 Tax=unclassified Janthinobacterium TaxID=2610881 RepID=UPI0027128259|nr:MULTISPECIES: type II secretion system protein [unclassified Janthinobacterium]MDO8065469.1 type II secretion system protein [Janthinobacterium sp. SUN206]MDO8071800.1 type II secretion system protein [Janthinobacterium sp. SUN176]